MTVRPIHTVDAPSHTGPVPQAVEAGGWIHVSALFGADPVGHAIPVDARAEAEQLFDNLAAILKAADAALTDVVRVGIVMRELRRDRPVFNQVWAERFGEHRPARSAIQSPDFGRVGENARFHGRGRGLPWLTPTWSPASSPSPAAASANRPGTTSRRAAGRPPGPVSPGSSSRS
jgi:2-iminobutanoate/2-iminopropanoate deaminase